MHLYSLTLAQPSQITHAINGNFSGTKQQLLVVARGRMLELLQPDAATGKTSTLLSKEIFGVVRALTSFRLTGGSKDYIVVGSDSGRIVILEYLPDKNTLNRVHMETFGKSGCRRIVPGQYLAVDPKGRSIMIGALEKQKLVYILNRDAAANLTISSPLEAHKSRTIVHAMTGIDVGFENPLFACLEINYEEADTDPDTRPTDLEQSLAFYELDLGLNHVVRKESKTLHKHANHLIPVPGGSDGPSGVIVCFEDELVYHNVGGHAPVSVRIPHRTGLLYDSKRPVIVNTHTMHKTKHILFFLVQTELGDVFKLTLDVSDDEVTGLNLKYFDSLPVASSLCLMRNGLLFVAAEFGNHHLYQVSQLGDNEDEPVFSSKSPAKQPFVFQPRQLLNLTLVEVSDSLAPILGAKVSDLMNEDTPQIYAACGRGPTSSLRVMRHGLEVNELAVSPLPGNPSAVWTVKRLSSDVHDSYIIVSFLGSTLVMSIGDTVEEVSDSGFLGTTTTIHAARIGDDALLQVYPEAIRHILVDKRVSEWKAPNRRLITHCAVNSRQVAVALAGGEIVYFEMDRSGQLNEYTERMQMPDDVICMAIGEVPAGAQRSRFLAIGCADNTVRIVSLDPNDCLQPLSMQALPARAETLSIIAMSEADEEFTTLYLNIGLENGVLLRSIIDDTSGDLSDTRTRYLGIRGVKLFNVSVQGQQGVVALSSRPWLSYTFQGHSRLAPLSYEMLEYASSFSSPQCPEGIVAISKDTLRILSVDKLGSIFNQTSIPLAMTPRKFELDDKSSTVVLVEGDHDVYSAAKLEEGLAALGASPESLDMVAHGPPRAGPGRWASNIRIVDPALRTTLSLLPLDENEIATSLAIVPFTAAEDGATYVVVGAVKELQFSPRKFSECFLYTYRLVAPDGVRATSLEFVHKTPVEDIPGALHVFHGRLLAGVGRLLRIYDLGKKRLLRKCENKHIPKFIVHITSMGSRIVVSDQRESFFFVKYRLADNALTIFADDIVPRWCVSAMMLDYSTIAGTDKFGNFSVVRLPKDAKDDIAEDPTGSKAFWDRGLLNGAQQKLETLANFYIGETSMALQSATLTAGGSECIFFGTMAGSLGVFVPFSTKEDVDFFQHLEMHLRTEDPPICGRDHLAYRSLYNPVKNIVDGDLCETFNSLDSKKKREIAAELDRTPAEVAKRLEDIRNRFAF